MAPTKKAQIYTHFLTQPCNKYRKARALQSICIARLLPCSTYSTVLVFLSRMCMHTLQKFHTSYCTCIKPVLNWHDNHYIIVPMSLSTHSQSQSSKISFTVYVMMTIAYNNSNMCSQSAHYNMYQGVVKIFQFFAGQF